MAKNKQPEENAEQPKKKGKLKLIILAALVLAILGGGGFFAYKYFLAPKDEDKNATAKQDNTSTTSANQTQQAELQAQLITLPTLVVNLADPLGRRYLKLTADLEIANKEAANQVQENMPKIKDSLILLLSSKTYAQLASIEQKMLLKKEIVARLNQILGTPVVKRVYFTEFIIQ